MVWWFVYWERMVLNFVIVFFFLIKINFFCRRWRFCFKWFSFCCCCFVFFFNCLLNCWKSWVLNKWCKIVFFLLFDEIKKLWNFFWGSKMIWENCFVLRFISFLINWFVFVCFVICFIFFFFLLKMVSVILVVCFFVLFFFCFVKICFGFCLIL